MKLSNLDPAALTTLIKSRGLVNLPPSAWAVLAASAHAGLTDVPGIAYVTGLHASTVARALAKIGKMK